MRKRAITVILAGVMVAASLTGCGQGSQEEPAAAASAASTEAKEETANTDSSESSGDGIVLRFSWWGGEERHNATLEVIKQFEELHPGITIEAEYGTSDGYNDKLATQLASGTAPDIIQIDPGYFPSYVIDNQGYFVDFNEYGFDFSKFDEGYLHRKVQGYFDGKQYGIPTGISGPAWVVNQDLADAIGLDFTKDYTFDDLIEWGKKVREYDSDLYLLDTSKDFIVNFLVNNLMKQRTGKTVFDEETKELNYDEAVWEEAFDMVNALYENEVCAPASYQAIYTGDTLQSDPNWIDGKYVCATTNISTIEVMTASNPNVNYSVGKCPVLKDAVLEAYSANTPQVMAVNAHSEHVDEAVMFLDYFFNDPTAMKTLGATRSVPPTAEAREVCAENGIISPLVEQAADIATKYNPLVDDQYYMSAEGKQILIDETEAVAYGVVTPEDAAKEVISQYEGYIATK